MSAGLGENTTVVAMSGGVDSSVAAALLCEQGRAVIGATLRLFDDDSVEEGIANARDAARHLGIAHTVIDGRELFTEQVLRPCWETYAHGRTPNPCVLCNPRVKLELLCEQAARLGAATVATGHYARVARQPGSGRGELFRAADREKDQSYFLCQLTPEQLAAIELPLGKLSKARVRELARTFGLPNAGRPESQDACAAQGGRFAEQLCHRFAPGPRGGDLLDLRGRVLGHHDGVHRFTVGQRRGLGIALGVPAWVAAIDPVTASVTVTTDEDALLCRGLCARDVRWHTPIGSDEAVTATVQIRYRHRAAPATVRRLDGDRAAVRFAQPVRAITPGQAAVFYEEDRLIGGGVIEEAVEE